MILSTKISSITASATFLMKAKAQELKRNGRDIVALNIGEPDFDLPENVKNAAKKAMDDGFNKYTDTGGTYELKQAIVGKFKRDNNIDYDVSQVMASNGGKQALFNIFQTILNEGDEVILPEPFWVSYAEQVKLAGGKPVNVNLIPNNFKLTADLISKSITPKTKAILLSTPSNPTGTVIDDQEIKKIAEIAVENKIFVISDEVYEFFYFTENKPISIASLGKEIFDLTFTVNAVSKTYSMTGWRLGFVGGPSEVIKLMDKLQGHVTSGPNVIAQYAAIEALKGNFEYINNMREQFRRRRDFVQSEIDKNPKLSVAPMDGAFYAFINVGSYYNEKIKNSMDFSLDLLDKEGLAVTPGSGFGPSCDDYIRISYAASMEEIEEGMKRLLSFLSRK